MEFLTVKEIQKLLKIGLNQAYDLVKSGELPVITLKGSYRVPKDAFDEWCKKRIREENNYE